MTFRYQAADVARGIARRTAQPWLDEQIFGGNQQIPGRGQTYLSDISLKVMCEKQRTSTFAFSQKGTLMRMVWTLIRESSQKRTLRAMLKDPRAARGFRSAGQLEKAIGADRSTTERLLPAVGARKSDVAEEWTLNPL
jgi:hypothetical protein